MYGDGAVTKVIELTARAKVGGGSWGIVGYFTDPQRLDKAKQGFGSKWILSTRELPLDTVLCEELPLADPEEAHIQSAIPQELHGINPRSSQNIAHAVLADPLLATQIRQLLELGFLGRRR